MELRERVAKLCSSCLWEDAKVLVQEGAEVNVHCGLSKYSPIHFASKHGKTELCSFLLDHGADIHAKSKNNETALHLAVSNNHVNTVELLIRRGAKHDIQNKKAYTPFDGSSWISMQYPVVITPIQESISSNSQVLNYLQERKTAISRMSTSLFSCFGTHDQKKLEVSSMLYQVLYHRSLYCLHVLKRRCDVEAIRNQIRFHKKKNEFHLRTSKKHEIKLNETAIQVRKNKEYIDGIVKLCDSHNNRLHDFKDSSKNLKYRISVRCEMVDAIGMSPENIALHKATFKILSTVCLNSVNETKLMKNGILRVVLQILQKYPLDYDIQYYGVLFVDQTFTSSAQEWMSVDMKSWIRILLHPYSTSLLHHQKSRTLVVKMLKVFKFHLEYIIPVLDEFCHMAIKDCMNILQKKFDSDECISSYIVSVKLLMHRENKSKTE